MGRYLSPKLATSIPLYYLKNIVNFDFFNNLNLIITFMEHPEAALYDFTFKDSEIFPALFKI